MTRSTIRRGGKKRLISYWVICYFFVSYNIKIKHSSMALSKCWILVFKQTANVTYLCTPMSLWQNKTLQNCTPVKKIYYYWSSGTTKDMKLYIYEIIWADPENSCHNIIAFQTRLHTHSWQDFHNKITARRSVVNYTSIGQQVLLYFVSTVLQHIGHVLSNLLHHTVNKQETSNCAVLNTNCQYKMSVLTIYTQTLRKQ